MKKLTAIFFLFAILFLLLFFSPSLSLAACRPPGYDPESDLDIDLEGWEEIIGAYPGIFDFDHPIDPNAPQFSTLIEELCGQDVTITSVSMIDGTDVPPGVPSDYGNLVCLETPAGQSVLVPNSGYDMGGGCEAVVLYATPNSIVLKYTPDDDIISGYTVYLYNFDVDPALLDAYNEAHNAGRSEMPCLSGGERIGTAGTEICVAVRDTGTFMDPRWQEWWNQCPGIPLDLLLKLINLCILPPWEQVPSLECDPTAGGDRDSRPFGENDDPKCDTCNLTRYLTPSCATGTTVSDIAWYKRKHNDLWCDEYDYPLIERPWGGTVYVDPSDTIIPFVGREEHESGEKYLADYLDGTTEYYEGQNYPLYWLDGVNHDGVWRKLTPMAYQDELKKKMVQRAKASIAGRIQEGKIHDYNVEYVGRLCWNAPLWAHVVTDIIPNIMGFGFLDLWKLADRCLYTTNPFYELWSWPIQSSLNLYGFSTRRMFDATAQLSAFTGDRLPPSPFEENYQELWDEWYRKDKSLFERKGKWAKLWEAVPMFSRENTPGWITPYLGQQNKDLFYTANPDAFIEKVPHVARLYEVGGALQKMLLPRYLRTAPLPTPSPIAQGPENTFEVVAKSTSSKVEETQTQVALAASDQDTSDGVLSLSKDSSEVEGIQTNEILTDSNLQEEDKRRVASSSEVEGIVTASSIEGQVLGEGTFEGDCLNMHFNTGYEENDDGSINAFVTVIYEQVVDQDRGVHFQPWVNGGNPLGRYANTTGPGSIWQLMPPWSGTPITLSPGQCQSISYGYEVFGGECEANMAGETFATNCQFCLSTKKDDEGKYIFTSTCGGPVGPPGVDVTCPLFKTNPVDPCNRVGITGPDGDTLCCDPIAMTLRGVDKFQNTDYCKCGFCEEDWYCDGEDKDEWWDEWGCMECHERKWTTCKPVHCPGDPPWLLDCEECTEHCEVIKDKEHCEDCGEPWHPTSRQIGVALAHPYLKEIWEKLSKNETKGVFNFLRPEEIPPFEDIDAQDEIGYSYDDTSWLDPCPDDVRGNVNPGGGDFFYPHLGGVQLAKEWLTGMLLPQSP